MFEILLKKLTIWRNETAHKEGVEPFRVLPNKTLEEIARQCPASRAELVAIKGIKDAKFGRYGRELLQIIKENGEAGRTVRIDNNDLSFFRAVAAESRKKEKEKVFSVGEFWNILNARISVMHARIKGEVSSVDMRNNVVYFSLKDKIDESVINCLIFRNQYDMLGIILEEGMEVVVEGYPDVYKPYGRLSLRVGVIELEGEGALKKEYELLKRKLEAEGIFGEANKKSLPPLVQNVGLITSRDGAAIGDFVSNIGKFGIKIRFINSSVEGKRAVFELIDAIKRFKKMPDLDAVVIIRGGGSLESLQAFNNEALIREAKSLKMPVICGVGHDRDVSLLSLAADYSVSTPTAAARLIGGLWEKEIARFEYYEKNIFSGLERRISDRRYGLDDCCAKIERGFRDVLGEMEDLYDDFFRKNIKMLENGATAQRMRAESLWQETQDKFGGNFLQIGNIISQTESIMKLNNPERQLRMGYGIISKGGRGVKSVNGMKEKDIVKIRLLDGEADSEIIRIKKHKK